MRRARGRVKISLLVLVALLFSKQLYVSSLSSYYIFYLIDKFGVSTQAAQLYLFIFLAANAVGAFFGGPLGDRFGRKYIIWLSILGALPFTLALPYAGLFGERGADDLHRADHLVGDVVDHRVRAGTDAAPLRHDLGRVLRRSIRHRRPWRRGARQGRRSHGHRLRLSALRLPSRHRPARGVPAEDTSSRRIDPIMPSCPALCRASTSIRSSHERSDMRDVDGRDRARPDESRFPSTHRLRLWRVRHVLRDKSARAKKSSEIINLKN